MCEAKGDLFDDERDEERDEERDDDHAAIERRHNELIALGGLWMILADNPWLLVSVETDEGGEPTGALLTEMPSLFPNAAFRLWIEQIED